MVVMSCSEDITSFIAARKGDGVKWLPPLGEGGTGVCVLVLAYRRSKSSPSCSGEGARLCWYMMRCAGGGGGGEDSGSLSNGAGEGARA